MKQELDTILLEVSGMRFSKDSVLLQRMNVGTCFCSPHLVEKNLQETYSFPTNFSVTRFR